MKLANKTDWREKGQKEWTEDLVGICRISLAIRAISSGSQNSSAHVRKCSVAGPAGTEPQQ